MRRVEVPGNYFTYVLRLWIRLPEAYVGSDMAMVVLATAQLQATLILKETIDLVRPDVIVKQIADQVENVNAVELLDSMGNGFLAYNDWP